MTEEEIAEKLSQELAEKGFIGFLQVFSEAFLKFLVKGLLARILGPASLGVYEIGRAMIDWLRQLTSFGGKVSPKKFIPLYQEENSNLKGYLIVTYGLPLISSFIIGMLLILLRNPLSSVFSEPELFSAIIGFSISLPFVVFTDISYAVMRGFKQVRKSAYTKTLRILSNIVLVLPLFYLELDLIGALVAFILSYFISSILSIYLLKENIVQLKDITPEYEIKDWLDHKIPVAIGNIAYRATRSTDIILLGLFMSSSKVGIYSTAFMASLLVSMPLNGVNQIFPSMISNLHSQRDQKTFNFLYKNSTRWVYLASLPIFLSLFFYANEILTLFFGEAFKNGAIALKILAVSEIFNIGFGSVAFILRMTDNEKWDLYTSVISALTNIVLNLFLIPQFGIAGAAVATGISLLVNNLLQFIQVYRTTRTHPFTTSHLKVIIPASIFILITLNTENLEWMSSMILANVGLGIGTILALSKKDREIILELIK